MQKRGRAAHIRLIIDGVELKGLNKCGAVKPETGELEVAEPGITTSIGDGQTKWPAVEGAYLDKQDNGAAQFIRDWHLKRQVKQVTQIYMDGHGVETRRVVLPDCENLKSSTGSDYDANGVQVSVIEFKLVYGEPIFL